MKICYPSKKNRLSHLPAINYGDTNEIKAIEDLTTYLKSVHNDVVIHKCGLFRSEKFPYLGATPDAIMECSCCPENYVIEVKCPIKCKDTSTEVLATSDNKFCMELRTDGKYYLKREHPYLYQVQLQMFMTNLSCTYFYVYGPPTSLCEVIQVDLDFLIKNVGLAQNFFIHAILPELLGKWFSRNHFTIPSIKENREQATANICTCKEIKSSKTITCCDKSCVVKEYHLECVGLEAASKKKWFCPYCRRKNHIQKSENASHVCQKITIAN